MSSERDVYERYWSDPSAAGPTTDPLTAPRIEIFTKIIRPRSLVLDAGCGAGRGSRLLSDHGYRVVGCEISLAALRTASVDSRDHFVAAALGPTLPFRPASFDAIYCADVLEHLLDAGGAVSEFNRVLKPGGHILVSVPFHGLLKNMAIVLSSFNRHFDPEGPHVRFFTTHTLRRLFERRGFVVEHYWRLGRVGPLAMNLVLHAVSRGGVAP